MSQEPMSEYSYRDGRFFRDSEPFFVVAAEYQYYRERPAHWHDRLKKLQDAGVNTITFYIPWRHHLRLDGSRRWYDFTGQTLDSRNVIGYIEAVASHGLLMIAKPGPFVHSELNVGGLPDLVCPSYNPEVSPVRRHHGRPAIWSYDNSALPAPLDERFDALVREWFTEIRAVLAPYCSTSGPVFALQLNDETVYCSSNDPPWHLGYEPSGMRFYHDLLRTRYVDIGAYNRTHGTCFEAFEFVPGPQLVVPDQPRSGALPVVTRREDCLRYVDWAEYQWKLRREVYARYKRYLNIDLPYLTNYAGITPPIEENVPDLQETAKEPIPADYAKLYSEWWFGMNRIEHDLDEYEYGFISWLGVAAYDQDVFDRFLNTARRARGINMEENWGFGTLYDARSRDPIVPFFQTLVSLAGGGTGYDIFVGVGTDYWDDTLDSTTKKQCPTFPSHAPIDEHGHCRPMYYTAKLLNEWFVEHGAAYLRCELDLDVAYLLYAPYAAVSSWIPDERFWGLADRGIPRCGHQAFEEFSCSLQEAGYAFTMFELEPGAGARLQRARSAAIHSAFFMDAEAQEVLAHYIEGGGRLFISGDLPEFDMRWNPCTRLKEAVARGSAEERVVVQHENLFALGRFAHTLAEAGILPNVSYSPGMRAYVHRNGDEAFVFFFNFDRDGTHARTVEFHGRRLELQLGSKTSGVVRISGDRLVGWLVKGTNEVEGISSEIRIRFGDQEVVGTGDFSSVS
jgi:beta-galactosidase